MTLPEYGPQELKQAITRSRALLPTAVDFLCELITEVTGRAPERDCVEFADFFWLMHICDRQIYGHLDSVAAMRVEPDPLWPSNRRLRSDFVAVVGSRRAPVRVVDPYLKTSFVREITEAFRGRRQFRWDSVSRPRGISSEILVDRRLAYAKLHATSLDVEGELRRAIALNAPLDVVEQHHELADWARSSADERIKVCYSANAHQGSTGYRHHLYEQRRLKSKIVFHQHGGGNGIDILHPGEFHDTTIGDIFYSWGWTREDLGRRVRPLPPALPAHHRDAPEPRYLLMSLPATSHFYRFQPFLIPQHIERAISETTSFVSSLEAGNQLRLRSSDNFTFPLKRLENVEASVTVDDLSEPGAMAASRARLVIHNYLGTTWLETLALNVPTVCFYDPRLYEPRESARPYFDMLARVGVLHHSGRDAAKFVNDLHGDPSSWWNSAEVQEAREAFVARYANFSDNWLEAWQTEFESLLAE